MQKADTNQKVDDLLRAQCTNRWLTRAQGADLLGAEGRISSCPSLARDVCGHVGCRGLPVGRGRNGLGTSG